MLVLGENPRTKKKRLPIDRVNKASPMLVLQYIYNIFSDSVARIAGEGHFFSKQMLTKLWYDGSGYYLLPCWIMQIMHLRIKYLIICTVIEDAHTCLGFFYSVPFGAVRLNKYKRYQFLKSYTTARGVCGAYTAMDIIYPMISSHPQSMEQKNDIPIFGFINLQYR